VATNSSQPINVPQKGPEKRERNSRVACLRDQEMVNLGRTRRKLSSGIEGGDPFSAGDGVTARAGEKDSG